VTISLPDNTKEEILIHSLPEEYLSKNFLVEVVSTNLRCFETYFTSSLKTHISEEVGMVKVSNNKNEVLSQVYVKVFAKYKNQQVKFYKDGYSDLKGKFDYLNLNINQLNEIEQFSILFIHEEFGSTIQVCNPPKNVTNQDEDIITIQRKARLRLKK
jgi:hypothetical protein